jgi:drug/metabolite transporter (DMT)-like permease
MIGIAYALMSAALFGVSAPFAKMLLGAVSSWLLACLLYLGSGVGLAVVRLIWRSKEAGLGRKDLPWLAAAVLSGGIVGPVLLLFGLAQSSASEAALLLNLESVLTLVMAWVVFKENVDHSHTVIATAVGILPCPLTMLVLSAAFADATLGIGLMMVAVLGLGIMVTIGLVGSVGVAAQRGLATGFGETPSRYSAVLRCLEVGSSAAILLVGLSSLAAL